MNKKIIIAGILFTALLNAGCNSFVARKDSRQIVKFKDLQLDNKTHELTLYKVNYPDNRVEKDKFYEDFTTLLSKMSIYKKDINIIIPLELKKDIEKFGDKELSGEQIGFEKHSYLLDEEDKKMIDEKIKVDFPKNTGSVQKYLNKQVAYWYNYLGEGANYKPNSFYTEFDKIKLIERVFANKKDLVELFKLHHKDFAIEVSSEDTYEVKNLDSPIYLHVNNKIDGDLKNIKSKIIIVDKELDSPVISGKILLVEGKTVENIKDYKINTVVKEFDNPLFLIKELGEDKGIKLNNLSNFTIKNIKKDSKLGSER